MDKQEEFNFLKQFIQESYLDEAVCRDQLHALWVAYCLHHGLMADTAEYDSDVKAMWDIISSSEESKAGWPDFDSFDCFMCADLV